MLLLFAFMGGTSSVEQFVYVANVVFGTGRTEFDVARRITVNPHSLSTSSRVYSTPAIFMCCYMAAAHEKRPPLYLKLQIFINSYLFRMIGLFWPGLRQ